jgi:hypothetical protein
MAAMLSVYLITAAAGAGEWSHCARVRMDAGYQVAAVILRRTLQVAMRIKFAL